MCADFAVVRLMIACLADFKFPIPYKMRLLTALLGTATTISFSGCNTWNAKNVSSPEVDFPVEFAASIAADFETTGKTGSWLEAFQSTELEGLVFEALEKNPSILGSAATLDVASYNARIAGVRLYPNIGLDGALRRNRSNTPNGTRVYSTSASVSAGVSWEIDLWGRVLDGKRAAEYDFIASEAFYNASRLSLAAEVARLWIRTVAERQQLDLSNRTLESFEDQVEIIEGRCERGISEALDLQLIRSRAASTRANVAQERIN